MAIQLIVCFIDYYFHFLLYSDNRSFERHRRQLKEKWRICSRHQTRKANGRIYRWDFIKDYFAWCNFLSDGSNSSGICCEGGYHSELCLLLWWYLIADFGWCCA